ncbi:transglutaminase domain-containing protein [Paenibacillus sp. NPDC058071]|uniref:transglutaminase domain-containing protein n=1 Tax=Paenibacillus sp. NPDC058071 TaxID=3346326 RepID=UPI0036DA77C7
MRKLVLMLTAVLLIATSVHVSAATANAGTQWLDMSNLGSGVVGVNYGVKSDVKTKVMIAKGNDKYTYNLNSKEQAELFPLQLGNGEYTVSVLENTSGNKYKVVGQEKVSLNLADSKIVYLNSIQNVNWNDSKKAVQKAKELTANKKTDREKVKAIYEYIITNVAYDNDLAAKAPTDYLPNIDKTLTSKKDICYGYAALFAAMTRSLDIPTKLVMGTTSYVKEYHAWNEVFLDGKWVIVDTTVDAGLKNGNKKYEFEKEAAKYNVAKVY